MTTEPAMVLSLNLILTDRETGLSMCLDETVWTTEAVNEALPKTSIDPLFYQISLFLEPVCAASINLLNRTATWVRGNMRVGLRLFFLGIVCLANLSCGSIPQPFRPAEDSKSHNEFLLAPNSGGVLVERIQGPVGWVGVALADAMAEALRTRGIVASTQWANRRSQRLVASGFQQLHKDRPPELVMEWSLLNAEGTTIERREIRSAPAPTFWHAPTPGMFLDVAEANVKVVSAWIQPSRMIVMSRALPSIVIADVMGAPGDGDESLARAIRLSLAAERIPLDTKGAEYLTLLPQVSVTPASVKEDTVRITWIVGTSNGTTIGKVSQENNVVRGVLDGRWGAVAIAIADGAATGIANLVRAFADAKVSRPLKVTQ